MIRVNDLDYSYSQQDHALKGIPLKLKIKNGYLY